MREPRARVGRLVVSLVVSLLAGLVCTASPAAESGDDARAVESLERELVAAIGRTDLAAYDRIVADDYVVFEASGREIPKAEVLESYRSGTRKYTGLEIFDVRSRVFGDTAVVSARTEGLRREDGHDVPNLVRYVRVYARRNGRWRAVTQMSAPVGK
jgi:ketosteroid isomerase-like protein